MGLGEKILSRMGLVSSKELVALQARVGRLQQKLNDASGVKNTQGKFGYEKTKELIGTEKWLTLDKMENDPHVSGALRVNTLSLVQADWEIKPASDDARDVEIAEFCSANLLRRSSDRFGMEYWLQTPWEQRLREQLDMLKSGFSMFAVSTKRVNGKVVFDRIKWLEPSSVDPYGWQLDERDNLVQVQRTFSDGVGHYFTKDPIPAENLALYVWDLKGVRLEGRPMIRPMYGAWFRKTFMQRMAVIWAQKVGAPSPMGLYPNDWPDEMVSNFEDWVQSLRGEAPAEAWFSGPHDGTVKPEVHYAGSEADVERGMSSLIASENAEIAHAGATKSDLLGETATGSRALGGTQQDREVQMSEAIAKTICAMEAHGVNNIKGLIERLVGWNYANVKSYPELVCSGIVAEPEPTTDEIVKAWSAGIIPKTPDSRRQLTQRYGLELPDDAYEIEEPPPLPLVPPPQADGQPPVEEENGEPRAALSALDSFKARIVPLMVPAKEGTPPNGGRFPDATGGAAP